MATNAQTLTSSQPAPTVTAGTDVTVCVGGTAFSIEDLTLSNNDLTNNTAVTSSTDTPFAGSTYSANYDGSSCLYIADANQTGLDLNSDFTVEFWVKFTRLLTGEGLFMKQSDGQLSYIFWKHPTNNCLYGQFYNDAGNGTVVRTTNGITEGELNTWIHFAFVIDISVPSVTIYKNGSSVSVTTDSSSATSIKNSTAPVTIGGRMYSGSPELCLVGKMDEVRIWSDIRTSTEIDNTKGVELTGTEANLVAYYQMEKGSDLSATLTQPLPTVSTSTGIVTSPNSQTGTLSQNALTITAVKNLTTNPDVQVVNLSQSNPTVDAIKNISVSPDAIALTLAQSEPTITLQTGITILPETQTLTSSHEDPTISLVQNCTVYPPCLSIGPYVMIFDDALNPLYKLSKDLYLRL